MERAEVLERTEHDGGDAVLDEQSCPRLCREARRAECVGESGGERFVVL